MHIDAPHLRLAGVVTLGLTATRGPKTAYVFDPHRLALPCWAHALDEAGAQGPATLITLDRHFDLVVPENIAAIPDRQAGLRALDEHARWSLDVRNYDHIVAAMEAGLIGDVVAVARARPRGALAGHSYRDRRGGEHRLALSPTLARIGEEWDDRGASSTGAAVRELLEGAAPILLDVDLDCFTTASDADPTTVLPWPKEIIRDFLIGPQTAPFWDAVLPRTLALTFAREPHHCGGLLAGGRLFADAAELIFQDLLGGEVP
ncbi:MAG: UPF0489 family protein [Myxococcota bacterium]|nr:UPF0489 family protein [Myxococcota bacterium]